jgi:hypothetical protein
VEHLRDWKVHLPEVWNKVVTLVQHCFNLENPQIPAAFGVAILSLLPKDEKDKYQPISLLETIHKLIATIIHRWLLDVIEFHPAIHGFCPHCGTDTAILECKLHMQFAAHAGSVLFQIFLDLTKAYDTVARR